jgi:N-acetylglutamate synthase-like GNAT family acetyltransferase
VEQEFIIRPAIESDADWTRRLLTERWGEPLVITRGRKHQADALPAFLAELDGKPAGLATYRMEQNECELVSLDSLNSKRGIGTALVQAVVEAARTAACRRVWLITTNDNLPAIGFYQRRGFELVAVHRGALAVSRRMKPSIPQIGLDNIPLRDEIELEMRL